VSSAYEGPRDAPGIVKYMSKQAGPSSKELKTKADLEAFVGGEEHSVVGFFTKDSVMKSTFLKSADALRDDFRFAHADFTAEDGDDAIVVYQSPKQNNKFEPARNKYTGKASQASIKTFIQDSVRGLVGVMTKDNEKLFREEKPLLVVYYDVDFKLNPSRAKYIRNRVLKVAHDTKTDITVAVANKDVFSGDVNEFNLKGDVVVGAFSADGRKYRMEGEFSVEALEQFIKDFTDGKLTPYIKSEPVPEQDDSGVTTVVGSTFDELITNSDKDVFVEFYAPWCGHCKSLAPKWTELGGKMKKGESNVVIAKMDATANDVPPAFEVRGYPTIYWVPAGGKPEKYNGGREAHDFVDFLKTKATKMSKEFKDEL